uniref:Uncharacterized protein n=1 Tax=Noccaea caerulescens TaxID=107243 RepID=A0A1J3J6X2_NOCCA
MKEIADFVDPRIRLKHQILMQEYQELREETEFKMRKLEMMKQKRSTLDAEVRFLRRRYKHLKQDQTLETNPKMLRLSESGDLMVPIKPSLKRKKPNSASVPCSDLKQKNTICNDKKASCDLVKKPKRSRGNEVLTNSIPIPDLNGDGNTSVTVNKEPGFDLNQISREEEEPEINGEQMVAGATKNAMLGNGINDLHCEMKLPICRDVEKELNRAVKRKVTWQDPVALSV